MTNSNCQLQPDKILYRLIDLMSDEKINEVKNNWDESDKFLKSLLSRLERKKRRIEGFNKFYLSLKRRIAGKERK